MGLKRGTAAREATVLASCSPFLQAAGASDRAAAQGIFVILLILSILSSCRSATGRDVGLCEPKLGALVKFSHHRRPRRPHPTPPRADARYRPRCRRDAWIGP